LHNGSPRRHHFSSSAQDDRSDGHHLDFQQRQSSTLFSEPSSSPPAERYALPPLQVTIPPTAAGSPRRQVSTQQQQQQSPVRSSLDEALAGSSFHTTARSHRARVQQTYSHESDDENGLTGVSLNSATLLPNCAKDAESKGSKGESEVDAAVVRITVARNFDAECQRKKGLESLCFELRAGVVTALGIIALFTFLILVIIDF
jgi:hypothetical protein